MLQIDHIISKVLSGNSTEAENNLLNNWILESEENKKDYEQKLFVWNLIGKSKSTPEVNLESAWARFESKKEQKQIKSFFIHKIAAVFIVLLVSGSFLLMFLDNKDKGAVNVASKNKIEKNNSSSSINLAENKIDTKSEAKITRHFINNDTELTNNIVLLPDSSNVKISSESILNFSENPSQTRIASLSGAGLFDIKPQDKDFVLETEELKILVQGTKFNINTATEEFKFIEIYVEEGFMEVFEKNNPANKINISSNQKFLYDIEKHVFIDQSFNFEGTKKWRKFLNKVFKNKLN